MWKAWFAAHDTIAANVNFHLVQIDEAHSTDKWPLAYTFQVPSAKTVADKHAYAVSLRDEFEWARGEVFVDASSASGGSFQTTFTAWPALYAVFHHGKLTYVGHGSVASQGAYDVNDLFEHLMTLC